MLDHPPLNAATAPLFASVADGPEGGAAQWLTTADGIRIRVGLWGQDAPSGTVLLFPGRTEYIEKYGRAARDLRQRGFATLTVDWRGQGMAARLLPNRALGHVGQFRDYQLDVAAMLAHARRIGLPEPFFLLAHSMGGCIGLRSVFDGIDVQAAVFTSPMWGIQMTPALRPVAWTLSTLSKPLRLGHLMAPGQDVETYLRNAPFKDNTLTSDEGMFDYMRQQVQRHPDLGLGGPTLQWLNGALLETRALVNMAAPAMPCLTFLGSDEQIVDVSRITRRIGNWPGARLETLQGARHEVMMEGDRARAMVFDAIAAHFLQHR